MFTSRLPTRSDGVSQGSIITQLTAQICDLHQTCSIDAEKLHCIE